MMQEIAGGSQNMCIMPPRKTQKYTSSDVKADGGIGSTVCRVDGFDQAQVVDANQCSEGFSGGGAASACSSCQLKTFALHRLKTDGHIQLHCTTCVLFQYKAMYCSQCFHVYATPDELGDPAFWLTCSKCDRVCHMQCAQEAGIPTDSFFFACQYCRHESFTENRQEKSSRKRSRMDDNSSLLDKETLAAAQIVVIFASKEAKAAKVRARACAAVAAKATKLAKSALDVAHKAGLEEMRWRLEALKQTSIAHPLHSSIRNLQSSVHMGEVRNQQTAGDLDDKSGQKMFLPPHHRVIGNFFGNVSDVSKAAATANLSHHQRRVLPPVVSTDVSGPALISSHIVGKPPQQLSSTGLVRSGPHGSLPPFPKDQRFARVSEGSEVDASPESILESSTCVGTPTSNSVANCDLPGRIGVHASNVVEILSDEEAVDDLVDVGDLLTEGVQKERTVANCLMDENVPGLPEGGSVANKSVEAGVECSYADQPPGTMLAVSSQSTTAFDHKLSESVADSISLS